MRPLLLIAALLPLAGCAELSLFAWTHKQEFVEPDQRHPVIEALCLWEQAEGQGLDGLPARGFAGQIFFFTRGRAEPAKINGDVTVYVFDDYGTPEDQQRPFHQFQFAAAAWNTFLTEGKVGPSYQLFLPYTRKGAHAASCSLRIKYVPADGGPPVFSRMATVALSGRRRPPVSEAATATLPSTELPLSSERPSMPELQALKNELAALSNKARTSAVPTEDEARVSMATTPDDSSPAETVGRYRLTP